jgi:hypothetical protein
MRDHKQPSIEYHSAFALELDEAARYLEEKAGLRDALMQCAEEAALRIQGNTQVFRIDRKMDARRCIVRRFPYVLYFDYDATRNHVFVYVLAHTSRKPAFWVNRLKKAHQV